MNQTLLLTGTIKPISEILSVNSYHSTSLDPEARYSQYIDTIIYYIVNSNFTHIVFCENSNYPIKDYPTILGLAKIYNKHFELLQYISNGKTIKYYGFHYGEAEAINYAVDHSKILKESKTWYKITGRYKYSNINAIVTALSHQDIGFYRMHMPLMFGIYTSIFKCTNQFYKKYLYTIPTSKFFAQTRNLEQTYFYILRKVLIKRGYSMYGNPMPLFNLQHKNLRIFFRNVYYEKIVYLLFINKIFFDFGGLLDRFMYRYLFVKKYLHHG